MKAINSFAILLLVVSMSCKKDNANTGSGDLKLEFLAVTNVSANNSVPDVDKIVGVLKVKSYNAKTGEITFNNNQLPDNFSNWKKINVYNTDAYLFSLTFSKSTFSSLYNEPVLYHSLIDIEQEGNKTEKNKWYILSGYPYGKLLSDQTITDAEQLKNFQKIESNWNVFVDKLKKSGKYIK